MCVMSTTLRVAVVDDQPINRDGTELLLSRVPGVEVVGCYDFGGAMNVDDWSSVDWVLSDIAHEKAGPEGETAPIIPLVERIRSLHPRPRPWIVAVTSNPRAFTSPVMMRRLIEADPDIGLVWRALLGEHLEAAANSNELDQLFYDLETPNTPDEIPELGVTADTKLNRAVELGRELLAQLRESTGRVDRWSFGERIRIEAKTRLRAARNDGSSPEGYNTPSVNQHARIQEAARLDEPEGANSEPVRRLRRRRASG